MKQKLINISHIAKLADLKLNATKTIELEKQLAQILRYISSLDKLELANFSETHQVSVITNVFRPDKIDYERILSQEDALKNATKHYRGYFVVDAVLGE